MAELFTRKPKAATKVRAKRKIVSVALRPEEYEMMKVEAMQEGTSMSAISLDALRQYFIVRGNTLGATAGEQDQRHPA